MMFCEPEAVDVSCACFCSIASRFLTTCSESAVIWSWTLRNSFLSARVVCRCYWRSRVSCWPWFEILNASKRPFSSSSARYAPEAVMLADAALGDAHVFYLLGLDASTVCACFGRRLCASVMFSVNALTDSAPVSSTVPNGFVGSAGTSSFAFASRFPFLDRALILWRLPLSERFSGVFDFLTGVSSLVSSCYVFVASCTEATGAA